MPKVKRVKKKGNRRVRKDNIIILVLILILIALLFWLVNSAKDIFKNKDEVSDIEIIDTIDNYNYNLTDSDTKYYKNLFNELKKILSADEINDEEYAQYVAKLFVVDFYDLDSKISKTDVGGIQFISKDYQDNFIKTATNANGMYYYVKSDLYGNRKQELPIVTNVDVVSIENTTFSHDKIKDDNAYLITLDVTYKKDLGYPSTIILTLAHNNSKIEIVEIK